MSTLRGSAQHRLVTPVRFTVRPITLALITVVIAAVLALSIALAASGGNGGPSSSVRVTPSAPIPASPTERQQPPGLNGPGMRP